MSHGALVRLPVPEIRRLLDLLPVRVRRGADPHSSFVNLRDPHGRRIELLRNLLEKGTGTDAERVRAAQLFFELLRDADPAMFTATGLRQLIAETSSWPAETVRSLLEIHALLRRDRPGEANEWMHWFLLRNFQERASASEAGRIPVDLYLDELRRNHPTFQAPTADDLIEARRAFEAANGWRRQDWMIDGHPHPGTGDPGSGDYGRHFEMVVRSRWRQSLELVQDLDTQSTKTLAAGVDPGFQRLPGLEDGKTYNGNFPELDAIVVDPQGRRYFAQITHGSLSFLRKKYLRLLSDWDTFTGRMLGNYEEMVEAMFVLGHIPLRPQDLADTAGRFRYARDYIRQRCRLYVPPEQVEGLRLLVASHDRFRHLGGGLLTPQQLLDIIQPVPHGVVIPVP